ncbi:MAG TPA: exosortase/archaeosortase family protein [Candidatus Brocadiia bacterium]|nr:exosortase/archaeosortase family protein [Candidatus Brocadiia bacterium]
MSSEATIESAPAERKPVELNPGFLELSIAVALILAANAETLVWMSIHFETHEEFSHGWLVPLISGYLIWTDRDKLDQDWKRDTTKPAIILLILSLIVHFAGRYLGLHVLSGYAMVSELFAAVLYFMGWKNALKLAFPIAYLAFMVPFVFIMPLQLPMQTAATTAASIVLNTFGVETTHAGVQMATSNFKLVVEKACSGQQSLIALTALATIFAYMMPGALWKKAVFICASMPVALVANVGRIVTTAILGHVFGGSVTEGLLHEAFGGLVFLFAFVIMFLIWAILTPDQKEPATQPSSSSSQPESAD